jgi:hypothetical protein
VADYALKISIGLDGVPQVTGGLSQVEGSMDSVGAKTSAATGRMAKDIQYVDTHLGRMAVTADDAEKKTSAANGRMAGGMGNVEAAAGRMAGGVDAASGRMAASIGDIETALKGVITAWGSWKILQEVQSDTMLAANVQQADRALSVIANTMGRTSEEALKYRDSLRDLNITTNSSTNAVAQFMKAGLPLNDLNKLGRAAQGAAISYGMMTGEMISSSAALDKMIRALVTGNVTELHTLGINVMMRDTLRENRLATGEASTAVDSHKRHLLMFNEVLEKTEPLMLLYEKSIDLAAKQISSSKRPIEELRLALGNLFLPELTVGATTFYGVVSGGMKWVQKHSEELNAGKMVIKDFAEGLLYAVEVVAAYSAAVIIATAVTGGFATGAGIFSGVLVLLQTNLSLTGTQAVVAGTKVGLFGESVATASSVATVGLLSIKTIFGVLSVFMLGWEVGKVLSDKFEVVRKAGVYMVHGLMTGWDLATEALERFKNAFNPFASDESKLAREQEITAKYIAMAKARATALSGSLADAVNGSGATATSKPYQNDAAAIAAGIAREQERLRKEAAAAAALASEEARKAANEAATVWNKWLDIQRQVEREIAQGEPGLDQFEKKIAGIKEKFAVWGAEMGASKVPLPISPEQLKQYEESLVLQEREKQAGEHRLQMEKAEIAMLAEESAYIQQIIKDNKARTDGIALQVELDLAAVNAQEKFYQITTGDAAHKRIELLGQSIALLQEQYKLEDEQGPQGDLKRLQILSKIRGENEKLLDQQKALYDRTAIGGMTNAIQKYGAETENVGKQIEDSLTKVFHNIEDAIVHAFQTGEFSGKAMMQAIAAEAIRMEIAKPLTNSIAQAFAPGTPGMTNIVTGKDMPGTEAGALAGSLPYLAAVSVAFSVFSSVLDENHKKAEAARLELARMTKEFNDMGAAAKNAVLKDQGQSNQAEIETLRAQLDLKAAAAKADYDKLMGMVMSRDENYMTRSGDSRNDMATQLKITYDNILKSNDIEMQQLLNKQALTHNNLLLQEMELQGLKGSAQYTATLTKVREAELYGMDATNQAIQKHINALQDETEATKKAADLQKANDNLTVTLLELQGKSTESLALKRKLETAGMDASTLAIQNQVYALTDQKTAADAATAAAQKAAELQKTNSNLTVTLLDLQGDAAGSLALKRKLETAGMDASTLALQNQIYALTDQKTAADAATAAAQKAAELQKTNSNLTVTLLELQGDAAGSLALKRQLETAGMDATTLAIKKQIYALEDQAKANDLATAAAGKTVDIALSAANAIKDIQGGSLSIDSPEEKYRKAQAAWASAAPEQAGELSKALLEASQAKFGQGAGYLTDYNNVMAKLSLLSSWDQKTPIEKQISLLEEIRDAITAKNGFATTQLVASMGMPISLPSFAVGTNYLMSDMVIQAHEGERIMPKADNYELMRRLDAPASNGETVAELKEQNRLLRALLDKMEDNTGEVKTGNRIKTAGFTRLVKSSDDQTEVLARTERQTKHASAR